MWRNCRGAELKACERGELKTQMPSPLEGCLLARAAGRLWRRHWQAAGGTRARQHCRRTSTAGCCREAQTPTRKPQLGHHADRGYSGG